MPILTIIHLSSGGCIKIASTHNCLSSNDSKYGKLSTASPACVGIDTPPSVPVTLRLMTQLALGSIAGTQQSALHVQERWSADRHCRILQHCLVCQYSCPICPQTALNLTGLPVHLQSAHWQTLIGP